MIYGNDWKGSVTHESGVATFFCEGKVLELRLDNFKDFHGICGMLDTIEKLTQANTRLEILAKI